MPHLTYEATKMSKQPMLVAITRVTTLVFVGIGMALLRTNTRTYTANDSKSTINYHSVNTYEYVFFGAMAGTIYTIFQVPFALYFFITKKRLVDNYGFLLFEFFADKVCTLLLATVVGSVFGATIETRNSNNEISQVGNDDAKDFRSKSREFCTMANVSGGFLLLGFLFTIVSSVMSSKAIRNK